MYRMGTTVSINVTPLQNKIKQGFSLIEVMVALVLLGIIVSLTLGSMSFLNRTTARAELNKMYVMCLYAQQTALARSKQQELVIDTKTNSYRYGDWQEKLAKSVVFGVAPGVKGPPSAPTRLLDSPVTFKDSRITFTPQGNIKAGTVYVREHNSSTIYALTAPISSVSYLRKYVHDGTGWALL